MTHTTHCSSRNRHCLEIVAADNGAVAISTGVSEGPRKREVLHPAFRLHSSDSPSDLIGLLIILSDACGGGDGEDVDRAESAHNRHDSACILFAHVGDGHVLGHGDSRVEVIGVGGANDVDDRRGIECQIRRVSDESGGGVVRRKRKDIAAGEDTLIADDSRADLPWSLDDRLETYCDFGD